MKTHTSKKPLTLGDFVMRVYDTCETQRAAMIVWLAMQTQQVVLKEQGSQDAGKCSKARCEGGLQIRGDYPMACACASGLASHP